MVSGASSGARSQEAQIMERTENNRYSRARAAETLKGASRHATPDAPERIYHRRRCIRHDHRTCCRGSRGSASRAARCENAWKCASQDRAGARPYRAARCENAWRCASQERVPTVARECVLTMREERSARGACLSYHPVSVSGAKPRRTVFSVTTRGNMQLRR